MSSIPKSIVFQRDLNKVSSITKAIGQCIYCGTRAGPLTREHVIPSGLGGGVILRDASCEDCRKVTHAFETECLRGMLLPYRLGFGLVRNLDQMPPTGRLRPSGVDEFAAPFSTTPRHLLLPELIRPAGLLEEKSSLRVSLPHRLRMYASKTDIAAALKNYGDKVTLDIPVNTYAYLRMIAKIAHGLVACELGLDNFVPRLCKFILGKQKYMAPYLFGTPEWEPPPTQATKLTHHAGWRVARYFSEDWVIAQIRLFATHETPPITVVVGTTELSDEDLRRIARPESNPTS